MQSPPSPRPQRRPPAQRAPAQWPRGHPGEGKQWGKTGPNRDFAHALNTYQITSLTNNTTYTFRITARDWAGNQTQQTRTTTIDRDPPMSSLIVPTDGVSKTWKILRWTSSSIGAPIVRFEIERGLNTTWQPLYATLIVGDRWLFEGVANTTYTLRIRATDAAGNVQSAESTSPITFTTGDDPTGLFRQRLPILLSNSPVTAGKSPDNGSPSPTPAYPLPQP